MIIYSSSTESLVLLLSLGEQASETWSQMRRKILISKDFERSLEDLQNHHPQIQI